MIVMLLLTLIALVIGYVIARMYITDWWHRLRGDEEMMLPPPSALHDWSKKK